MTDSAADPSPDAPARRRPQPGERRMQILQALAAMLEQPGGERVTTAALAARLQVSEAALYRHFASKAQMFEGLIGFIEDAVFSLVNQITAQGGDPLRQAQRVVAVLLQFAERNPGLCRVLAGDALVLEHERLRQRMNLFFDKLEAALRQMLREAPGVVDSPAPTVEARVRAAVLMAFAEGRLQQFVRSGYRRLPTEALDAALARLG